MKNRTERAVWVLCQWREWILLQVLGISDPHIGNGRIGIFSFLLTFNIIYLLANFDVAFLTNQITTEPAVSIDIPDTCIFQFTSLSTKEAAFSEASNLIKKKKNPTLLNDPVRSSGVTRRIISGSEWGYQEEMVWKEWPCITLRTLVFGFLFVFKLESSWPKSKRHWEMDKKSL